VVSEARQALQGHIGSTVPRTKVWRKADEEHVRWVLDEEVGASLLRWLLMLLGRRCCQLSIMADFKKRDWGQQGRPAIDGL
jgi:hypothetical protein